LNLEADFLFFDSIVGDFVARLMHTRYAALRSIGNHEPAPEITKSVKRTWSARVNSFRSVL